MAVPLTPVREAVMVLDPEPTPVANPLELMVATDGVADVHVAVEVMSAVVLSL